MECQYDVAVVRSGKQADWEITNDGAHLDAAA